MSLHDDVFSEVLLGFHSLNLTSVELHWVVTALAHSYTCCPLHWRELSHVSPVFAQIDSMAVLKGMARFTM